MSSVEEIGKDPRNADGYVVLFQHGKHHTGVLVVPSLLPLRVASWKRLQKLINAVNSESKLGGKLMGLAVNLRTIGVAKHPNLYEITFAIENGKDELIERFLEYAKQCHVLENPIVSDMRDFKVK